MLKKYWSKALGDRRQEIVFIGLKNEMNENKIREMLDACLIKDYSDSPKKYQKTADPFPLWFQKVA